MVDPGSNDLVARDLGLISPLGGPLPLNILGLLVLAQPLKGRMAEILRRWEAEGKTGANMRYIGLALEVSGP